MSRRTDIPNTSSSTPKSSQGRRNKKTVLPMKIATSGDKEEHNQRRKHELCEYGTSREIFSENFDGTTQLRNGQTPVDGNKGDLDEEIMEDEGRRMKRKARERERERGVELFIISLFRCKQCKCERREMNNFFISETKHISIIVFFIEKNIFAVIYQYRGKSAIKKNTSSKKINLHPCKLRGIEQRAMYRSRSSCSSSKVAPSNCAESDTTVPDSPARAEKFAESWNLLRYGEILEDLKNDSKSHGEILENFSLTKLPISFS
ncbi:unnamed protein product [Brassica napus]|uniref:(rape) hypothetical protein n=3 Tax=Brassica napus TaxID=3708 RepID=A0A816UEI1_BRANA|nr:unnamed protein product [Brassica napus]